MERERKRKQRRKEKKGKGKKGGQRKGKEFSKSSGQGNQHWNFMKGTGNNKGTGRGTSWSTLVYWSCGKTRQVALKATVQRIVFLRLKEKINCTHLMVQEIGPTLVSPTTGPSGPSGRLTRRMNLTMARLEIRLRKIHLIHFGRGFMGFCGPLGLVFGLYFRSMAYGGRSFGEGLNFAVEA